MNSNVTQNLSISLEAPKDPWLSRAEHNSAAENLLAAPKERLSRHFVPLAFDPTSVLHGFMYSVYDLDCLVQTREGS